jgi:hypothetical protein
MTRSALALCAGLLASATVAQASPIVLAGSTYDVFLQGQVSGEAFGASVQFGTPEVDFRAGLTLNISDAETDLGGGVSRISINIVADGELFPTFGEQSFQGLGRFGDGLDLLQSVYLLDARIKLFTPTGLLFSTSNLADDYRFLFSNPWDGFFPVPGASFFIGNVGGNGVNGVTFEFEVTPVPEPTTLALFGAGLAGLARSRRLRLFVRRGGES